MTAQSLFRRISVSALVTLFAAAFPVGAQQYRTTSLGSSYGSGMGSAGSSGSLGGGSGMGASSAGSGSFAPTGGITSALSGSGLSGSGVGGGASRSGAATSATGGVSASNAFGGYFANPLAAGLPTGTGRSASFGTPLYGALTQTGAVSGAGVTGATSGVRGSTGTMNQFGGGLGGYGAMGAMGAMQRQNTTPAAIVFPYRPLVASGIHTELRGVIARSTSLPSRGDWQVHMEGGTVVLRGNVADERERRLAERLVRLSPGVRDVRNELTMPAPAPRPIP